MATDFPFVEISPTLAKVVGEPKEGTRLFQADGDADACRQWTDALFRAFPRGLVSPGGAGMYAGVSRAAVHKALKEGRLTGFTFQETKVVKGFFGKRIKRANPYVYVPVAECRAWHIALKRRAQDLIDSGEVKDRVTLNRRIHADLEGPKPDWDGFFLDEPPKKKQGKKGG